MNYVQPGGMSGTNVRAKPHLYDVRLLPLAAFVPTNHGGLYDEDKLPSDPLPELMRQAGYQTAGFGKTHWNHGVKNPVPSTRGFEVRAVGLSRDSGHYEDGAVMMGDAEPEGLAAYYEETKDYGGGEENSKGYLGCTSQVPTPWHRDGWVAEQCLTFIDEGLDESRPLFLYLSFLNRMPASMCRRNSRICTILTRFRISHSRHGSLSRGTHLAATDAVNESSQINYWEKRHVWEAMTPEERTTTLRYWANCSWLDDYWARRWRSWSSKGG